MRQTKLIATRRATVDRYQANIKAQLQYLTCSLKPPPRAIQVGDLCLGRQPSGYISDNILRHLCQCCARLRATGARERRKRCIRSNCGARSGLSDPPPHLLQPCSHPRLAADVPRSGLRLCRRLTRFECCLDPLDFLRSGLGQASSLLLLLAGQRQTRQWRGQLDRHAVGQPGNGLTQRQLGIQPGRAPALGVALRLSDAGGAHFLHLPHLLAFHP